MKSKQRITLGMSGGVDSSVSAQLLISVGYDVEGVTCLFVDDKKTCQAAKEAAASALTLGISHHVIDCVACFSRQVISPFIEDYQKGLTPSPCVGCNASCKIPSLLAAANDLGCSFVSTGHYARIEQTKNGRFVVKTALDTGKDQSYMLSRLSQEQLSRLILPLGTWFKDNVRNQAKDLHLAIAEKPDSQDNCFIEGNHVEYLKAQGVTGVSGDIVTMQGKVVGKHHGLFAYTIGQRKGIGVAAERPYYVLDKNSTTNELVVGFKEETTITGVEVSHMVWQAFESCPPTFECSVKLRYRSKPAVCRVTHSGNKLKVTFDEAQPTTAPGQFAVFYHDDTVLGSGIIDKVNR